MNIEIKAETRRYHVSFEIDKSTRFVKGPNKGRPQTVTECWIGLLGEVNGITLVGRGTTTLGSKDDADSVLGCKIALERALDDAKLGKAANGLFWQEFQLRHRRGAMTFTNVVDNYGGLPDKLIDSAQAFEDEAKRVCQHKVGWGHGWCVKHNSSCSADVPCGSVAVDKPVHGYGGLYSHQRRAVAGVLGHEQSDRTGA